MRGLFGSAISIAAGDHVWAVFRSAFATTQVNLQALAPDGTMGRALVLASASDLTSGGAATLAMGLPGAAATVPALKLELA
jgi:hypothetical protein